MRQVALSLTAVAALVVGLPAYAEDMLARGEAVYRGTCIACHGIDGAGVMPGVSDLTTGALAKADAVLIESLRRGISMPGAALAMPPRGGNPALTDEDLRAVLYYMRRRFSAGQ